MTVLDASAVLALILEEPGSEAVAAALDGAEICSVNLAEVIGKLVDAGGDGRSVGALLEAAGTTIVSFTAADAAAAGILRDLPGGRALSLGDRCCLALALRAEGQLVLTADRAWASLPLPLDIKLIR